MGWVVELHGYDIAGAAAKTLRFAMGRGIAFSDQDYAPSGFKKWSSATQKIDIDASGQVKSTSDAGTLELINLPADVAEAGPLDALADWAWQNRAVALYWAPDRVWAHAVKQAHGILEQPIADVAGALLTFRLRDPRAALDVALQPKKYGGTNVAPNGVDGDADLKGKPLPVGYGVVSNIAGVWVNKPKLIWQLFDVSGVVLCVRDGAVPYTAGVIRGSLASLLANDPAPGHYDSYAGAEGTFARLGTKPVKTLAFDAQVGATEPDRTHAQVWQKLRTERCATAGGDILAASVTDLDVIEPHEVGFWWDAERTRRAAMDEVLASLSGYEVFDDAGKWRIAKLLAPSGPTVVDFVRLAPDLALTAKARPVTALTRVRPNVQPNGAPPYRVNLQWGRNYSVMSLTEFLGGADPRLVDKFQQEFRVETATNATIWDPVALTGLFPDAPELTIATGYQPGADGVSCPHAAAEAARLIALYASLKQQFTVGFTPNPGDHLLPGQVVSAAYPAYGLAAAPLFRVLQVGITVELGAPAVAQVVIGLQT